MDDLDDMDHRIVTALRACGTDPRVAGAARALSWAGEHGALWLAAGFTAAAVDAPRRTAWLRGTALTAGAHVVSMGVKRVVRRPRPAHVVPLVRTAGGTPSPAPTPPRPPRPPSSSGRSGCGPPGRSPPPCAPPGWS